MLAIRGKKVNHCYWWFLSQHITLFVARPTKRASKDFFKVGPGVEQ